jgi:hypothetical protein
VAGILSALASAAVAVVAVLAAPPPTATLASADSAPIPRHPVIARLAVAADFDPGLLISDERFYDTDAMDVDEVQAFLEAEACRPVEGVECLADYRETTVDVPDVGSGHCAAYAGDEWEAASVIIVGVAQACGINPEVLLVMLQKEQSLVTAPSPRGYERAMGYACPDTADCDAEYFGFFNQVYNAAWQFRQYTLFPTDRAYRVGTVDVGFNPDAACGAAPVDIRNQATANLYLYTPYQPNQAALDQLYGEGDGCSSYGNRNFWRIFTDWFGDPVTERFPDWAGICVTHEGGAPCVDEFWIARPER